MIGRKVLTSSLLLLFVVCGVGESQDVGDQFILTLNPNNQFVIEGYGELAGLSIVSPSQSLVPASSWVPFAFPLQNTVEEVALIAVPGTLVTIDGQATLQAGWNPAGQRDVTYEYGNSNFEKIGPLDVVWPSANVDDTPEIFVNADNRLVIRGMTDIGSVEVTSASGSIVPAPQGPFDFSLGRPNEYRAVYGNAITEPLEVNGDMVLDVQWNPLGEQDLQFSFGTSGYARPAGPFDVDFNTATPTPEAVRLLIDENNRLALEGNGQRINELFVFSEGASLVPSQTGAPFDPRAPGDANNDVDSILLRTANGAVEVTGRVPIDAAWDRNRALRDLHYTYVDAESGESVGPLALLGSSYPIPPAVEEPIVIDMDRDTLNLAIAAAGNEIRSLRVVSPSGSITPSDATGPFASVESSSTLVEYRADGHVVLDGTYPLEIAYNLDRAGEDLEIWYEQNGFAELRGPIEIPWYPSNDLRSPLNVGVNNNGWFWISGRGQRLVRFTVRSEDGALRPATDDSSIFDVVTNTENEITLEVGGGDSFDVSSLLRLPIQWDESSADLSYEYALRGDDVVFGPVDVTRYPGDVHLGTVRASFESQSVGLFALNEREIIGFTVTSRSGSLLPVDDTGPFNVEFSSEHSMTFTLDEPLTVGQFLALPIKWDGNPDLVFDWETPGIRDVTSNVRYIDSFVPEPASSTLLALGGLLLLGCRRRRN